VEVAEVLEQQEELLRLGLEEATEVAMEEMVYKVQFLELIDTMLVVAVEVEQLAL